MKQSYKHNNLRRQLLRIAGIFSVSALVPVQAKPVETPNATEGPYYPLPSMRYDDIDNDLVKIAEKTIKAGGEIVTLKGIVTDMEQSPLSGIRIEIWQCDVNGRYLHSGDSNAVSLDSGFQGFGHTVTNEKGEYAFRTIKPVSYPGRTPHIHVKVFKEEKVLTSQFYIKEHPQNRGDNLFRRMSTAQQKTVEMQFSARNNAIEAVVNIIC